MNEISLRIKIANREYPMRVKAEEEENVRMVSRLINDKVREYRNKFSIEDKQDLLAMVAFEAMMDYLKKEDNIKERDTAFSQNIGKINKMIKNVIDIDQN